MSKQYFIPNKEGTPQRVSLKEYDKHAKEIINGTATQVCSYVAFDGSSSGIDSPQETGTSS